MRSTLEIILAVKEQQPATDEELRFAIVALSAMQTMDRLSTRELAEAVRDDRPDAKFRARFLLNEQEIRFKSMKMPVDQYLEARDIPGTPENVAFVKMAKSLFKKATGVDL